MSFCLYLHVNNCEYNICDTLSVSSSGGDDHHRGVHSGCICVPYELQPQEPGTSGEPRGLVMF